MEIKDELLKPYSELQKRKFYLANNARNGYLIKETETSLQAWGRTDEEESQRQAEITANLHLTRGDVFRALLLAKGITRAQIRALIEQMPEGTQEEIVTKELALIDFDEALDFYRGVSLINTLGEQLHITSKQMDNFFRSNDWHDLVTLAEE